MVKVRGRRKLAANFKRLTTVDALALSSSMRLSLVPMNEQVTANAKLLRQPGPRPRGGHLDQGVVTRKVKATGRFEQVWWVALTRRARSIGHLVEFGTRPHDQPRRGTFHPGATPRPFFRSAEAEKREEVKRTFVRLTWQVISASIIPTR